jgi:hypothetical protein
MTRHLKTCAPAHDEPGRRQEIVLLRIDAHQAPGTWWLHLEARAGAPLWAVDELLRVLWLECCGHMSAFYFDREEVDGDASLDAALRFGGPRFEYDYDFGSTTRLRGEAVARRKGRFAGPPVRLLARNDPPVWECTQCGEPATLICPFCGYPGESLLCVRHAESHGCEDAAFLPVVNSPRMGVCGYEG